MRFSLAVVCFLLCSASSILSADDTADDTVEGKVTRIIDGDSILVTDAKSVEYEVQLEGIDAPELKQDFGKESTEGLTKLINGKSVRLTWKSKDNFERLLAQVYDGEKHINIEMIKTGMAWHFKRYNKDETLAKAESAAKEAKKGLWATESPVAPWDYRKDNKAPDKPLKK
jgi:micrococcal nuclease